MKTKDEFIKRWENHIAGLALFGSDSEAHEPPTKRAERAMAIPENTRRLLSAMYEWLVKDDKPLTVNGQAAKPQQKGMVP